MAADQSAAWQAIRLRHDTSGRPAMTYEMRYAAAALLLLGAPGALSAQQESTRLLGEVRVRGEADRPAGVDTLDAFTLLRSRIGVEATLSPRAVVLLQLQDARTFGEELSPTDGRADRIDMHQAWLQYRIDASGYAISLRAGRQEIGLGNERLVGASNWTNTGRSFDGLRAMVGPAAGSWRLNTLAATVRERGRRFAGVQSDRNDQRFGGAFLEAGAVELFALHDREAAFRVYSGVNRTTLGSRLNAPLPGPFTASLEGSYQVGTQALSGAGAAISQDIRAWMTGVRTGVVTPLTVLPSLGLGLDVLSGDADPADGTYRAFNTLYATGHRYHGYMDLITDPAGRTRERGLINGIASARVALPRDLGLDIDAHGFWTQQQFAAAPDRFMGWELDLTLPVRLGPGQQLQLGYSVFRNGAAAPLVGLGREGAVAHWAYLQASFSFGGRFPQLID
jgi:hypothetical protein